MVSPKDYYLHDVYDTFMPEKQAKKMTDQPHSPPKSPTITCSLLDLLQVQEAVCIRSGHTPAQAKSAMVKTYNLVHPNESVDTWEQIINGSTVGKLAVQISPADISLRLPYSETRYDAGQKIICLSLLSAVVPGLPKTNFWENYKNFEIYTMKKSSPFATALMGHAKYLELAIQNAERHNIPSEMMTCMRAWHTSAKNLLKSNPSNFVSKLPEFENCLESIKEIRAIWEMAMKNRKAIYTPQPPSQ
jgi:hypothetical protein